MKSGIEVLLRTKGARTQFVLADDATWRKWAAVESLPVWQAVVLHSHLDPDCIVPWVQDSWPFPEPVVGYRESLVAALWSNLDWAIRHLEIGYLPMCERAPRLLGSRARAGMEYSTVTVAEFHAWATRVGLPVVTGWRTRTRSGRWPWGEHTTDRLEQLARVGELWRHVSEGGTYDPRDDGTAPKWEVVQPFLKALGIPKVCGEVMASILRPQTLRPGPRPKVRPRTRT